MRWTSVPASIGLALGLGAAGCWWGQECDPEALARRLAGPDALDCGAPDGWDDPAEAAAQAHDCAAQATAEGWPFHVGVTPASADGSHSVLWIGAADGTLLRLDYEFAIGQMFGPDSECWSGQRCSRLDDRGRACDGLWTDLCLACAEARAATLPDCPAP